MEKKVRFIGCELFNVRDVYLFFKYKFCKLIFGSIYFYI